MRLVRPDLPDVDIGKVSGVEIRAGDRLVLAMKPGEQPDPAQTLEVVSGLAEGAAGDDSLSVGVSLLGCVSHQSSDTESLVGWSRAKTTCLSLRRGASDGGRQSTRLMRREPPPCRA